MIETLTFTIAGLGIMLVVILLSLVTKAEKARQLSQHRSKAASVADLLIYAAEVDDGVIVGKDGSFMAAWLYSGDDKDSSTEQDRESVSARINRKRIFNRIYSGWLNICQHRKRPVKKRRRLAIGAGLAETANPQR